MSFKQKVCENNSPSKSNDALFAAARFYAQKQLLLSARLSHRNSVHLLVRHTGGSVKNGASKDN